MASAATDPIVVGSCQASIQGTPGQQVSLAPPAVTDTVADLITAIHYSPTAAARSARLHGARPTFLGHHATGQGTISGGHIADQVIDRLTAIPLLGPVLAFSPEPSVKH